MGLFNIFEKKKTVTATEEKQGLESGLEKTKQSFWGKIVRNFTAKSIIDSDFLEAVEEALLAADVGTDTTLKIIEKLEQRTHKDKYTTIEEVQQYLQEEVLGMLSSKVTDEESTHRPHVIMIVGVNGVGKTTTIGKLASQYKQAGAKVVLGAADTFRAAAIEQLSVWAERTEVPIVKQQMGADPASVVFDTLKSAVANNADVVLIDTAGRLHNKVNLMNELTKIKSVMQKVVPGAPHEILLVLDGTTGQNAYRQAVEFSKATQITGLVITKLDGTAKGGVVLGITDMLSVPVKYIGVGEKVHDLQVFHPETFVKTLFSFSDV